MIIDFKATPEGVELWRRFKIEQDTPVRSITGECLIAMIRLARQRADGDPSGSTWTPWARFPEGFDPGGFPDTSAVILPSEHSIARISLNALAPRNFNSRRTACQICFS
jgi:hypothetical protein